ncbi:MAG: OsmC family protein [Chitinophagales bacterium]
MLISKVTYSGDLRSEATHVRSGSVIINDAPPDNQGKGEAFSPTDMVATAMATCMLTIMGIAARRHEIDIKGTTVDVGKVMADNPRRISEIHCTLAIPDRGLSDKDKILLENAGRTCPVIQSLSPEIRKVIQFTYKKIKKA